MARTKVGQVPTANVGVATTAGNSTAGVTVSHTVDTGTTILFVCISSQDSNNGNLPITTVTFGGVGLTKAIEQKNGTNDTCAGIWYLLSPSASTANVVATSTGAIQKLIACFNVSGVIAQAPQSTLGASGVASSITLSPTTTTDFALVLSCTSHKGSLSSTGVNQTQIAATTNQSFEHLTVTYKVLPNLGSTPMVVNEGSSNSYSHATAVFAATVSVILRSTSAVRTVSAARNQALS